MAVAVQFWANADDNGSAGDADVYGLLYEGRDCDVDDSEVATITEKLLLLLLRLYLLLVLLLRLRWTQCCRMLVYDIVDRVFVIVWVVQLLLLVVGTTFCCCI